MGTLVRKGIVGSVGVLAGGRFVAFDAKSMRNTRSWRVKVGRRWPSNDTIHQWDCLAEVQALGGLAFYLNYAETLDRVYVTGLHMVRPMPFAIGQRQAFSDMIEVLRNENGWWDWLRALEGSACCPCRPMPSRRT